MATYIELDLVTDADALLEIGVDYMEGAIPGFVARSGNVETVLLEASSQVNAEVVEQAAVVPPVLMAYLGGSLFGVPIREATTATGTATITFAPDASAVMVAAGSLIAVPNPTGSSFAFETVQDVVAPAGGGNVAVGISAVEAGADANGCFGPSELIDVIDGVDAVMVAAATAGGTDQETADDYLDRLTDTLTILAPRPILPGDFAVMARGVPGVGRALAIDLYQPGTNDNVGGLLVEGAPVLAGPGASPVERCNSTAIVTDDGSAPSQALMHTVWQTLDAAREVNFLNYVIPPTYSTIDVRATVVAFRGFLAADVQANAETEMAGWLDPSTWGSAGTTGDPSDWTVDTSVRLYEAIDFLNRAMGLHYVISVELRKDGGAWVSADIALTGAAPLPRLGVATITVQPAP